MKSAAARRILVLSSVFFTLALASSPALAWCYRYPDLDEEIRDADIVAIGRVIAERETPEPGTRSDGGALDPGHTYTVEVVETLSGRERDRLEIFAEYNSGQFPMDAGESYLIFATPLPSGHWIDACGNSGPIREREGDAAHAREVVRGRIEMK